MRKGLLIIACVFLLGAAPAERSIPENAPLDRELLEVRVWDGSTLEQKLLQLQEQITQLRTEINQLKKEKELKTKYSVPKE